MGIQSIQTAATFNIHHHLKFTQGWHNNKFYINSETEVRVSMGLEISIASYKVQGGFYITGHTFNGKQDYSVVFNLLGLKTATLSCGLTTQDYSYK